MAILPAELATRSADGTKPKIPLSPDFDIPPNLKRRTLKTIIKQGGVVSQQTWNERADAVEERVQKIIASQNNLVETVVFNPPYTQSSDLTVDFKSVFPVRRVKVEVKSSTLGLRSYKDGVLQDTETNNGGQLIGPWAKDLAIEHWLVSHNTVLINGGEKDRRERTAREILDDSFYPQIERISATTQGLMKKLGGLLRERYHSMHLSSAEIKPIQIFP